jgi:hypothetical protein
MEIKSPKECVYYYECYNGEFRLTYFIPTEVLKLISNRTTKKKILKDFPDGVDLKCTEAAFEDFKTSYDYRPDIDPEEMRNVFLTVYSATRDWKKFRGTGIIKADVLEGHLEKVNKAVEKKRSTMKPIITLPKKPKPQQIRQRRSQQAVHKQQIDLVLEKLEVRGIASTRTMVQQRLPEPDLGEGEDSRDLFNRIHRKKIRRG